MYPPTQVLSFSRLPKQKVEKFNPLRDAAFGPLRMDGVSTLVWGGSLVFEGLFGILHEVT
jgi:hypothetical protein